MSTVSHIGRYRSFHQAVIYLFLILFTLPRTLGLYFIPDSNCTSQCTSFRVGAQTNGSAVTCYDSDYNLTDVGVAFQGCVACQLESPTLQQTTAQTDLGWALFNLRYSLEWCIFGSSSKNDSRAASQCSDACSKISTTLKTNIATPDASTTYDYCQDSNFLPNVDACSSCFRVIPNQRYMSNYLNTLQYACDKRPETSEPFPIPPSAIFTLHPPSNYSGFTADSKSERNSLPTETQTAIAICVPVLCFLLLSFLLVWCYIRRTAKHIPSRTPSQRSRKHISKSTDTEKGWSHTSNSPPKHQNRGKRSAIRTHGHSRGSSDHSGSATVPHPAPLRPEKIPIPRPLRTRSSRTLSTIYSQAAGSQTLAANPTNDTLVTAYTTANSSQHSIPILSPARYEPPVPTLPPNFRPPTSAYSSGPSSPRRSRHEIPPVPRLPPLTTFQPSPTKSLPIQNPTVGSMPGPSPETQQRIPHPPPPSPPIAGITAPPGLMSWERVALQNARLRTQMQSTPSPVSPLTMPAALGGLRSVGSNSSLRSRLSSPVRSPSTIGPTSGATITGQPLSLGSPVSSLHSPTDRPSARGSSRGRSSSRPPAGRRSNSSRSARPGGAGSPVPEEIQEEPTSPIASVRSATSARDRPRPGSPVGSGHVRLPLRPSASVPSLQSQTGRLVTSGTEPRSGGGAFERRLSTMESAMSNLGRRPQEGSPALGEHRRSRHRRSQSESHSESERRKEVRWSRDVDYEG